TLAIQAKVDERIREDSLAWITSQNLLGDKEVHITVGTPGKPPLPPGSTIRGTDRSAIVDIMGPAMAESTSELLENLMTLLREVNAGKGSLGQFLKSPELYNNMNEFTKSIAASAVEMRQVAHDMKSMMDEVRSQKGTLGKLIFSEAYAQEFT